MTPVDNVQLVTLVGSLAAIIVAGFAFTTLQLSRTMRALVDGLDAKIEGKTAALDAKIDAVHASLSARIDALDAKTEARFAIVDSR
ncbi:MAG: hypothetical protein QM675_05840, partial [Protaetiibacter sp.]